MKRVATKGNEKRAIADAVGVLRGGGVVAYPTDTLYGLAVDPRSLEAVERLFDVKGRDRSQAIPLIAADLDQAREAGTFTAVDLRLVEHFWPGPLTVVVTASGALSRSIASADGTVGIRVPAHTVARELAWAFGFCITATSANLSGQPATRSPDVVAATLGDRVDLLLDDGMAPGGEPSTIVAVRTGTPQLIRAGAVAWDRVLKSLQ